MVKYFWLCCLLVVSNLAAEAISLPAVISSGMVLQRNAKVKIWGWGNPGERIRITTSWDNRKDSVTTSGHADWEIAVQTPDGGGPYTITLRGHSTIVLENVLIGELWVCSGQSNMEMSYGWGISSLKEEFGQAASQRLRFFQIPKTSSLHPQDDSRGKWTLCDSNTLKSFSAAAYYFGKELSERLGVPVGLIHASWGGTAAEVWTPAAIIERDEVLQGAARLLTPTKWWPVLPGRAYNGMIAPLTPLQIAGVIWYQGESNTNTAATYAPLLKAMIQSWRREFHKEFPFYYVQIAPFKYGNRNVAALLREQQQEVLSLSGTGMVVTTDLVEDTADIHPKNKKDIGLRLAKLALVETYNRKEDGYKSPLFESMKREGGKVVLAIRNTTGKLLVKGKDAVGFWIAGSDRQFLPATVQIKGNTIAVWNKEIREPAAVRYAFSNTAVGNVFSSSGLPLAPFRTDTWTVDTTSIK